MSDKWPHARLFAPQSMEEELRLTFACRRNDAFPDQLFYDDPTSNFTIAYRANDLIRDLLSRWALTGMLDGYYERLCKMRDRSAAKQSYRTLRDLKVLRSMVRTKLYDVTASAHEIEDFVNIDDSYRKNVLDMKSVLPVRGEYMNLIENLKSLQYERAHQILRDVGLFQSVLSSSGEISQTISNIRIQRLVVLLAIVSIGIAILSFIVSIPAAS